MRGEELLDVLEHIDPVLIEEADRKPKFPWLRWTAVAACVALVIGICALWRNTNPGIAQKKYMRISFKSETLGEEVKEITADTAVIYMANETFQPQMPIYEISKHAISEQEFRQMEKELGITDWDFSDFDGYEVHCRVASYGERGDFDTLNMTDEELEELARETFSKIPFLEGEYAYAGQTGYLSLWSTATGEVIEEVTVSFYRCIDGISVVGNEKCNLTFDGNGLVGIYIAMYDYAEIGTMDMVSLNAARERIKTPDYFSLEESGSVARELQVDRVQLSWVNQYFRGCTILQPIYTFYGTATLESGNQTEFKSRIIAIPEEMTYEE